MADLFQPSHEIRPQEKRVFFVSVAGYSSNNDDGTKRQTIISQCLCGDAIELRVFPEMPPSKRIAVFTRYGQIGFIDPYHAPRLARELELGTVFNVEVESLDSRETVRYGKTDVFTRKGNTAVKLRFGVL